MRGWKRGFFLASLLTCTKSFPSLVFRVIGLEGREEGRKGGREEGGREGEREREREGGREGEREGGREE